jgi:hypothetical protein
VLKEVERKKTGREGVVENHEGEDKRIRAV